jgi:hypothetical protein
MQYSMEWGGVTSIVDFLCCGEAVREYGNPLSFSGLLRLLGNLILYNTLLDGRSLKLYETSTSMFGRRPFLEDWATLFKLLEEGKSNRS